MACGPPRRSLILARDSQAPHPFEPEELGAVGPTVSGADSAKFRSRWLHGTTSPVTLLRSRRGVVSPVPLRDRAPRDAGRTLC